MHHRWGRLFTYIVCCLTLYSATSAGAVDFPQRTVSFVYGAPAGASSAYVFARMLAQGLSEKWGQPVVVETRPGANQRIAAAYVARAKPDGYTLLVMSTEQMMPPPAGMDATFDIAKDLTPVVLGVSAPNCFVAPASLPANSVKEVLVLAKAQSAKLNAAVFGTDGFGEMAFKRLFFQTKTQMEFLRYTGSAPAVVAMLGNEVHISLFPCASAISQVQAGALKFLAVSNKSDLPMFSSVPTFEEAAGLPGFSDNKGITAPAGTPKEILNKIRNDSLEFLGRPEVRQKLAALFLIPDTSQDDYAQMTRDEVARWIAWTKEYNEALAVK